VVANFLSSSQAQPRRIRKVKHAPPREDPDAIRDAIRLIDDQLDALEMIHIGSADMQLFTAAREALTALESLSGEPFPDSIRYATTSYQLHEALLDFQATLLDRALQLRGEYAQSSSDDERLAELIPIQGMKRISASALALLRRRR
jgi:hypothetical protein